MTRVAAPGIAAQLNIGSHLFRFEQVHHAQVIFEVGGAQFAINLRSVTGQAVQICTVQQAVPKSLVNCALGFNELFTQGRRFTLHVCEKQLGLCFLVWRKFELFRQFENMRADQDSH